MASCRQDSRVRISLELCWDTHSPPLLDRILGILPSPKTALKHQWTLHPSVLEHPSNSCSPHTEPRLVYDSSFVASETKPSKLGFEVSVKCIQILVVGSWDEVVEEVSISRAGNMGPRVGGSGASIEDNDVLGV
jgi:hypothetical protein